MRLLSANIHSLAVSDRKKIRKKKKDEGEDDWQMEFLNSPPEWWDENGTRLMELLISVFTYAKIREQLCSFHFKYSL